MCPAPCLAVVVGDNKATVMFSTEHGALRQRTIELGADATEWPTTIMLLAGNLVRDEAADLLPDVPAKVAAPVAPIVPAPPAPEHYVAAPAHYSVFAIGLVPGLSTDLVDTDRDHLFALSAIVGMQRSVHGISLAGAVDV